MFQNDSKFTKTQDAGAGGRGTADDAGEPASVHLGRLRLLVALDCLLVEGSVGRAAARMRLSPAAMSRMLAQARAMYGDRLLVRSARGLVPTPRAEALRQRLRALAAEAQALLEMPGAHAEGDASAAESWKRRPLVEAPPLAMRPALLLDDQPSPEELARQLARVGEENDPRRRLAKYIAIIGRGIGNSRPLAMEEAQDAFALVQGGEADPMQIGAFLRLLSYRGETAAEMAGIVAAARRAARTTDRACAAADLDWPAYLSPRSLRTPWFLQAARLVALAGCRVVLHGSYAGSDSGRLELACETLGIPVCRSAAEAAAAVREAQIGFLPLPAFAPKMAGLLALYPLFEARSPVNGAVHLLNPLDAPACLLGVAQPAYSALHRDAAALLGHRDLSVIGSSRDVAEWIPFRSATVHRLVGGTPLDMRLPALAEPRPPRKAGLSSLEYWRAVWLGTAHDARAERIVTATAALALMTAQGGKEEEFALWQRKAEALWNGRPGQRAMAGSRRGGLPPGNA